MKVFAVCSYCWEYNDEYNYQPDGEPAEPIAVFASKEIAEADALQRNIQEWRNTPAPISNYASEGSVYNSITNADEVIKALRDEFGVECDDLDSYDPDIKAMSDAQMERLMELFPFMEFYCVRELPFNGLMPTPPPPPAPEPEPGPAPKPRLEPEFAK